MAPPSKKPQPRGFFLSQGTDFKNMAQGLELAIDLHIHEVFSKVCLPEPALGKKHREVPKGDFKSPKNNETPFLRTETA